MEPTCHFAAVDNERFKAAAVKHMAYEGTRYAGTNPSVNDVY